jgi:hypothetical protein
MKNNGRKLAKQNANIHSYEGVLLLFGGVGGLFMCCLCNNILVNLRAGFCPP